MIKFVLKKDNIKTLQKIIPIILVFSIMFSNVFGSQYIYLNTNTDESSVSSVVATPEFTFQSASQILIEPTTGKILYANNENEKLLPASVTKVMTLLLIMEQIDSGKMTYTDRVTCSTNASKMGGSQIWFREGEELTVDEALKAICVVSANDVTVAMAEKIGGSEQNFAKMMNDKAAELGMANTHFMNSHGIDEENHYTTAKDIALMSAALVNNHPDILKYTSIWMDTLRGGTFGLSSTNKLIRFYEGATGLKTGSTSKALFNLSASATRNGTTFISVIMKAPTSDIRLQETKQLLDFGFATYETKNVCDKDTVVESKKINKNVTSDAVFVVKQNVTCLTEKGSKVDYQQKVVFGENLTAPINVGTIVGSIQIIDKVTSNVIGSSDIVLKDSIEKSSFKDYLNKIFNLYIINS